MVHMVHLQAHVDGGQSLKQFMDGNLFPCVLQVGASMLLCTVAVDFMEICNSEFSVNMSGEGL